MSQVPVKWVEMDVLLDADEKQCYAPSRQDRMIPVVPLSALRDYLEQSNDGCITVERLLASLGEGK